MTPKENLGSTYEFLLPVLNELLNGKYLHGFCGLNMTERIEKVTYSPDSRVYNIHTIDEATGRTDSKTLTCASGLDLLADSKSPFPKSEPSPDKLVIPGHLSSAKLSEDVKTIIKNEKSPTQKQGRLAPSSLFKTELTDEHLVRECRSYAERPDPD